MSSNQLMWLLPIAVIAGLAWWLLADRGGEVAQKTSPIQTGSIEQPIHPGSLVVNDTNLGQTWDKAVNGLTRALVTVTDKASAEAALPKLQSAAEEFQQLSTQSNELPMEGRSALATLVTKARPSIEDLFVKILEIPGVSEVAKPVIDTLRTHLDKLAQA